MTRVANADSYQDAVGHLAAIYKATVTLTDAQIKALPTTPIVLVAAPGSAKAILPIGAVIYTKTASGAYTNINAAGVLECNFASGSLAMSQVPNDTAITNGSITRLTSLLGTTTPQRAQLVPWQATEGLDTWGPVPDIQPSSGYTNSALRLDIDNNGGGNLTGGNAANSLTVIVFYAIVDVP